MVVNEDWKPNFYKYEKVRRSGRYNMITEARQAIEACDISNREYRGIAERFEMEAIRDTYKRARVEWKNDRVYGTELSMILNHKCWYWHEKQNTKLSQVYAELWEKYHD